MEQAAVAVLKFLLLAYKLRKLLEYSMACVLGQAGVGSNNLIFNRFGS